MVRRTFLVKMIVFSRRLVAGLNGESCADDYIALVWKQSTLRGAPLHRHCRQLLPRLPAEQYKPRHRSSPSSRLPRLCRYFDQLHSRLGRCRLFAVAQQVAADQSGL